MVVHSFSPLSWLLLWLFVKPWVVSLPNDDGLLLASLDQFPPYQSTSLPGTDNLGIQPESFTQTLLFSAVPTTAHSCDDCSRLMVRLSQQLPSQHSAIFTTGVFGMCTTIIHSPCNDTTDPLSTLTPRAAVEGVRGQRAGRGRL